VPVAIRLIRPPQTLPLSSFKTRRPAMVGPSAERLLGLSLGVKWSLDMMFRAGCCNLNLSALPVGTKTYHSSALNHGTEYDSHRPVNERDMVPEHPGPNLPHPHNVMAPASPCAPGNHPLEEQGIAATDTIVKQNQGESAGESGYFATSTYSERRNSGRF
jgi:hypothetical protein